VASGANALHTHLVVPGIARLVLSAIALASCATGDRPHATPLVDPSAPSQATVASVPVVASAASPARSACPTGMLLVEGAYCPDPVQICLRWLDPPGPYHDYRCAEYSRPARCNGPRKHERFCIDPEEYVAPGDSLPLAHQSWTSASNVCESRGRRLCLESEWQFACEGEEMRPYPYGFVRDATACNIDRMDLGKPNAGLNDLRAPVSAYPRCVSPFGVHDMSGNVEEWTTLDHGSAPQRSSMKGAWWLPGKNTCRARTLGHGEIYEGPQVGVRCCADAK
jgi:sulfatase modifying factor 1